MDLKRFWKTLLVSHLAIKVILTLIATALLVYSLIFLDVVSPISIASYIFATYILVIWGFEIPRLIRFFKTFKDENKYMKLWREDARLRVNASLYGSLTWNTAYALLQLGMGIRHGSFWFYSLSGYYMLLAVMRFSLVRHTIRHKPGEKMREELHKYRMCGGILLVMNLALLLIIFFMVYWNRAFNHHEVTAISLAAYTFVSLPLAILSVIRYRKYNSPVYSASKALSLVSACVSVLILESTLMTTFGDGDMTMTARRILLGVSGGVVSAFVITVAVYMIVNGTKKIKKDKE